MEPGPEPFETTAPVVSPRRRWRVGLSGKLLVLSQVILSMQLSFAVIPLIVFTNDKEKMGSFVNKPALKVVAWAVAGIILSLNLYLLIDTFRR